MSGNIYTSNFMLKIPRTPLARHIEAMHEMAYWSGIYGSALELFEHHLMAIAVATAEPLRYGNAVVPPPPERYDATLLTDPASMAEKINRAFREAGERLRKITEPKTPEQAEARAKRRYERMINEQRTAAKMYLRDEVRRVRAELGLPEKTSPTKRGQS